jgi:hypothetical protein
MLGSRMLPPAPIVVQARCHRHHTAVLPAQLGRTVTRVGIDLDACRRTLVIRSHSASGRQFSPVRVVSNKINVLVNRKCPRALNERRGRRGPDRVLEQLAFASMAAQRQ